VVENAARIVAEAKRTQRFSTDTATQTVAELLGCRTDEDLQTVLEESGLWPRRTKRVKLESVEG
jgi:hypothetical protein